MGKIDIARKIRDEYKTMRNLVKFVLDNYPNTHNSDTKLFVKVCRILGIKSLTDLYNSNLNILSVDRTRRFLVAKKEVKIDETITDYRKQVAKHTKEYFRSQN
jgi:hypothetical protein